MIFDEEDIKTCFYCRDILNKLYNPEYRDVKLSDININLNQPNPTKQFKKTNK